jgi:hypothetical protein
MAFNASWMAMCTMAYSRDSCSGSNIGVMPDVSVAAATVAFHSITGSVPGADRAGADRSGSLSASG